MLNATEFILIKLERKFREGAEELETTVKEKGKSAFGTALNVVPYIVEMTEQLIMEYLHEYNSTQMEEAKRVEIPSGEKFTLELFFEQCEKLVKTREGIEELVAELGKHFVPLNKGMVSVVDEMDNVLDSAPQKQAKKSSNNKAASAVISGRKRPPPKQAGKKK